MYLSVERFCLLNFRKYKLFYVLFICVCCFCSFLYVKSDSTTQISDRLIKSLGLIDTQATSYEKKCIMLVFWLIYMSELHNLLKISSTNCRGLGDYAKRKDVFNFLRDEKFGIYCLQDTHFTTTLEPYIRAEWEGEVVFSSYTSNSRGVCILFSDFVEYKVHNSKTDQNGNMLILDLEIERKRLTLANIYGPNDDSPNFFLKVQESIEEFDNEIVIICGDFNLVQNQELDTFNYINVQNPNAKEAVLMMNDELNIVDHFREIHVDLKQYTWRKRNPVKQARLDFFLLSEIFMTSVRDINFLPSYRSDHSSVVLSIEINELI